MLRFSLMAIRTLLLGANAWKFDYPNPRRMLFYGGISGLATKGIRTVTLKLFPNSIITHLEPLAGDDVVLLGAAVAVSVVSGVFFSKAFSYCAGGITGKVTMGFTGYNVPIQSIVKLEILVLAELWALSYIVPEEYL